MRMEDCCEEARACRSREEQQQKFNNMMMMLLMGGGRGQLSGENLNTEEEPDKEGSNGN